MPGSVASGTLCKYVVFKTQFAPDSLPNYDTYLVWTKTTVYIFFYSADFFPVEA